MLQDPDGKKKDEPRGRGPTRRAFLGAAAAFAAQGCLYGLVKESPGSAIRWPVFRFALVGRLGIAFGGEAGASRFAHDAAEAVRGLPDLDFAVTAGNPLADGDPMSATLAGEIVSASGERWYCSPSPGRAISGCFEEKHPWICSPVEGVRLMGLAPCEGDDLDACAPWLTAELDKNPDDLFIAALPHPARKPGKHPAEIPGQGIETLRYILDAAPGIKVLLSTAPAPPFAHQHAGLVHVCVPPPSEFPHAIAEITVWGRRISARFRRIVADGVLDAERAALAASPAAKEHDPADPSEYVKGLEGPEGELVFQLR